MEILVPMTHFLRVEEKFTATFSRKDKALGRDALAVYLYIFASACRTGVLRGTTHQHMADWCHISQRTVQYALRELQRLEYLHVESAPGHPSAYILLLSARVLEQIRNYDLIENPGWYPRDEQRAAFRVATTDAVRALSLASQPAQQVREGYAQYAHPSYKEDKKEKIKIPPSPQRATGTVCPLPCAGTSGGGAIFCQSRRDLPLKFERLWAVWPLKKNRHRAQRAFVALGRAGILPSLESLLVTVRLFAEQDSHWRNGYPPELTHWLRGRRWEDEPFVRNKPVAAACAEKSAPTGRDAREKVTWEPRALPRPALPAAAVQAVEHLCGLWPGGASPMLVRGFFQSLQALGRPCDPLNIVEKARSYLRETPAPAPLGGWLRSAAA